MTGEDIRRRRLALGLSQAQLARALDVDRLTISSWEVGRHRPSMPGLVEREFGRLEAAALAAAE